MDVVEILRLAGWFLVGFGLGGVAMWLLVMWLLVWSEGDGAD